MKYLLSILFLVGAIHVLAYDFEVDGIYYNITSDSTLEVTFENSSSYKTYANIGAIIIPETITYNDAIYVVAGVGEYAFYKSSNLVHIELPSTITFIGSYAFEYCTELEDVNIPAGVTSIEKRVFYHCEALKSLELPETITSIGTSAISCCYALTSLEIPEAVTDISEYAFNRCTGLESITLPSGKVSLGTSAFRNCTSLTSVSLPTGLVSIPEKCFYGCTSLREVYIHSTVILIGDAAFMECDSLFEVYCTRYSSPTCASPDNTFGATALAAATLHVPEAALSDYTTTSPWSEFSNIVTDVDVELAYEYTGHRPVYEEFTGLWCGFCPRGAVWMAIMKDLYPDDFIGISYHYNDALQMLTKSNFPISVSSYPSGYFDRQGSSYTYDLEAPWLLRGLEETPAKISADAILDSDKDSITSMAYIAFSDDVAGGLGEVEFILVADSLHNDSWSQRNYYSSTTQSSYEEYWKVYTEGDSYVYGLYYNDVVLATSRVSSAGNITLTDSAKVADTVTVSYVQSLSFLDGSWESMGIEEENLKVVALLIDKSSGVVVDACETRVTKSSDNSGESAITPIVSRGSTFSVHGGDGVIIITSGEDARVDVYSLGGQRLVSTPIAQGSTLRISAPAGIYIVNGHKVIVR